TTRGGEMCGVGVEVMRRGEKRVEVSARHDHRNLSQEQRSPVKVDNITLDSVVFTTHHDILQVQIPMIDTLPVQTAKSGRHCVKNFLGSCLTNETISAGCP